MSCWPGALAGTAVNAVLTLLALHLATGAVLIMRLPAAHRSERPADRDFPLKTG